MSTSRFFLVGWVMSWAAVACTTEGGSEAGDGSTSVAATTSTEATDSGTSSTGSEAGSASSSGEGSSSSSGGGSVSGSSSSTGEPAPEGPPVCTRECELPSDCCGFNEPGCPSAIYPGNYGCVDGACVPPACRDDAECEAVFPGTTCHRVFGHPQCVQLCEGEASDCGSEDTACLGQTDDALSFCRESCVDAGTFACPTTTCDEATGLCLCEPGDCPTGETCAPL